MKKLILISLVAFAVGCSKKSDPSGSVSKCRIDKMEMTFSSGAPNITTFDYDNNGRLLRIVKSNNTSSPDTTEFIWQNGFVRSVNYNGTETEKWFYTNNRLTQRVLKGYTQNDTIDYTLNSAGQPTEITESSGSNALTFTYDSKGNVTLVSSSGLPVFTYSNYDDKRNPNLIIAATLNLTFFVFDQYGTGSYLFSGDSYSKNNPATVFNGINDDNTEFTYNSNGTVATSMPSPNPYGETLIFTYSGCN